MFTDSPYTVTMQFIVGFSHGTLQCPSLDASQCILVVQFKPAPVFCIITQVIIYLKGRAKACRSFKQFVTMLFVHSLTFFELYECSFKELWIAERTIPSTSSAENSALSSEILRPSRIVGQIKNIGA